VLADQVVTLKAEQQLDLVIDKTDIARSVHTHQCTRHSL
jgi:hypothetical protein